MTGETYTFLPLVFALPLRLNDVDDSGDFVDVDGDESGCVKLLNNGGGFIFPLGDPLTVILDARFDRPTPSMVVFLFLSAVESDSSPEE
jgi:hypothetical protein